MRSVPQHFWPPRGQKQAAEAPSPATTLCGLDTTTVAVLLHSSASAAASSVERILPRKNEWCKTGVERGPRERAREGELAQVAKGYVSQCNAVNRELRAARTCLRRGHRLKVLSSATLMALLTARR